MSRFDIGEWLGLRLTVLHCGSFRRMVGIASELEREHVPSATDGRAPGAGSRVCALGWPEDWSARANAVTKGGTVRDRLGGWPFDGGRAPWSTDRRCPSCGALCDDPDWLSCHECGTYLGGADADR